MNCTCTQCGSTFERDASETWKRLCLPCWIATKADKPAPAPATPAPIDPTMLRRLIQLCHPDRHGGSEASHTATAWLLTQRDRAQP